MVVGEPRLSLILGDEVAAVRSRQRLILKRMIASIIVLPESWVLHSVFLSRLLGALALLPDTLGVISFDLAKLLEGGQILPVMLLLVPRLARNLGLFAAWARTARSWRAKVHHHGYGRLIMDLVTSS